MKEPFLSVSQLQARFPGSKLPFNQKLWDFSFPGSGMMALVGSNGSGKTTFMRVLLGELDCIHGQVIIPKSIRCPFAYLPQEAQWDPYQSVQKHLEIAFFPKRGLFKSLSPQDQKKCAEMADELHLQSFLDTSLGDLSSGLRQRVFLARTLLQEAPIVLLDEPTNHLDLETQEKSWQLLKKASEKKLVILSSHDLERVAHFCRVVLKIEDRELIKVSSDH